MPLQAPKQLYSYADYLTWPENERWELIDGVAFDMTPAPYREHQDISIEIEGQIRDYLKNKKCKMYHAPFDVRLPEPGKNKKNDDIFTVIQPDILIVCDLKKLDKRGCLGAPDLVVEIISSSTVQKDKIKKFNLYERHGIKEYWLVHPSDKTLTLFQLGKNKKYGRPLIFSDNNIAPSAIFKGLNIDLKPVFQGI